jgi:hypothetical protein
MAGVTEPNVEKDRLDDEAVGVALALLGGLAIFLVPLVVVSTHTWLLSTWAAAPLILSAVLFGVTIWAPVALGYWRFRRGGLARTARGLVIGAGLVLIANALMIGALLLFPSFED